MLVFATGFLNIPTKNSFARFPILKCSKVLVPKKSNSDDTIVNYRNIRVVDQRYSIYLNYRE